MTTGFEMDQVQSTSSTGSGDKNRLAKAIEESNFVRITG